MKVLYISIAFPKEEQGSNLYTDLAEEIAKKHEITVIATEEKRNQNKTELKIERGIRVLRTSIGNIYNVGFIEKGISYITMQKKIKLGVNKFLKDDEYDLIIFTSPPVTIGKLIKFLMKKYNAKSYLMQKDIFPQNSLDLGVMKKTYPAYWYFKIQEKELYKLSSKIGCMSEGNIKYLLDNNSFLEKQKLELLPNSIKIRHNYTKQERDNDVKEKYNIPKDSVIALYGGNFGKPQGVEFIEKILELYKNNKKVYFMFCGKGTEKNKLYDFIKEKEIQNVITLDFLPKHEYDIILQQVDIGLIFLDYRFTIPNIPSRTLSYFEYGIPIMAATDKNTDYKDILLDIKAGLWCEANNIDEFKKQFDFLIENDKMRKQMGQNGREFLEKNWTVEKTVEIIENAYKRLKGGK